MRIVKERDLVCQFWPRVIKVDVDNETFQKLWKGRYCEGEFHVHEPGHRSQGADPTDPDACVLLCRRHHLEFAHGEPLLAKRVGL